MKLNTSIKIILVIICLGMSVVGFLIKLPSGFRHADKELHALFYFSAAAFLNILFTNKKVLVHIVIFAVLYLFGMAIEYAQEYSNKLFHKRIHGRYDVEDIRANFKGLVLFSVLWIMYTLILFTFTKLKTGRVKGVTD